MTRNALISGLFACTAMVAAGCASSGGTPTAASAPQGTAQTMPAGTQTMPAGTQVGRAGTLDPAAAPAGSIFTSREPGQDPARYFVRARAAYRHTPSNVTCDDTFHTVLGDLALEKIVVESADGRDFTCTYVLGGYGVYITQHVTYEPDRPLRATVQKTMTNLSAAHGNHAEVRTLYPLEVKAGPTAGAEQGSFGLVVAYPGQAPFRVLSMTAKVGGWVNNIAGTYPDTAQAQRFEQDLGAGFAKHTGEIRGR